MSSTRLPRPRRADVKLPELADAPAAPRRSVRLRDSEGALFQDAVTRAAALKARRLGDGGPSAQQGVPFLSPSLIRLLGEGCNLSTDELQRLDAASPVVADVD
ncbi:hypothetical protein BRADI_5g27323v3 [Brachypodium distachyon]|uniref:Uncharacterized protein n=1 Tax=Brachypodium distachyon TaxID=15368 RepID=A0A2K2CJL3_BRADI|nr:hypothetical protein BRADI_5g27323v3 [Brachypodium distachyon]